MTLKLTRDLLSGAQLEGLTGDRDGDLAALRGGTWDAVIDTSAYRPRHAAASAAALRGKVRQYAFVSTASVYAAFPSDGVTEDTATMMPPVDLDAPVSPETYGPLKVGCERAVQGEFGARALIVRPGLLAGPYDPTGRFRYWVARVADGGEVLAPGDPARLVQLLDARDLAYWLISAVESGETGVYNTSGPASPLSMTRFLEACRVVTRSDARFTWAADAFLLERGVIPWTDLPLWLPAEAAGLLSTSSQKAQRAGLSYRPLAETIADVLADGPTPATPITDGPPRPPAMSRARERELLVAWHMTEPAISRSAAQPLVRGTA